MAKKIVIAVDTKERTRDALALGRVLVETTGAPAVLVTGRTSRQRGARAVRSS